MRILWITNNPISDFIPEIKGTPALGGSWIMALANALVNNGDYTKLAVVTNIPGGKFQKLVKNSITQYCIPLAKRNGLIINDLYPELVDDYQKVIDDFAPDIIHIHGTERYFGLLATRGHLNKPVVISIQGIITSYYDYLLGGIPESTLKQKRSLKNLISGGVLNQRKQYKNYRSIEEEILTHNTFWFCRTNWDRSQVLRFNQHAIIFQGEELLRSPFYETEWDLKNVKKHSIFISSGTVPIKGFHVLLEAASILRRKYSDLMIRVPLDGTRFDHLSIVSSNDYELYLNDLIRKLDLRKHISFLGKLDQHQMAATMASSHVFALPSFNENSPNSLGEAMLVGTPSVVAPVGGVPDIVENNVSALYANAGDAALLAYQIERIFNDNYLALRLSAQAKETALKRHDIQSTIHQYQNAYGDILARERVFTPGEAIADAIDL
jgi:glycosyltransferase involved in cell wall biosynthesis